MKRPEGSTKCGWWSEKTEKKRDGKGQPEKKRGQER